jgi:hypothetical protein
MDCMYVECRNAETIIIKIIQVTPLQKKH